MLVDTGKSRPGDEHHPPAHHTYRRETVATLFQSTARTCRQLRVWSNRQSRQGAAEPRPVPGHRNQADAVGCSPPAPAVAAKQCPQHVGQCCQRLHATGNLKAACCVDKGKFVANSTAQSAAAVELLLRQGRCYPRNCHLVPQGAADLRLCRNWADIPQQNHIVQSNLS